MVAAMNHIDHLSEVSIPLNGLRNLTSEERSPSHNEDSENNKQNGGICGLKRSKMVIIITTIITTLLVLLGISVSYNIFYHVKIKRLETMSTPKPSLTTSCSHGWIQNAQSCYLFSVTDSTWNSAHNNCSSYGASLLAVATREEMTFINEKKAPAEYWLGLQRKSIGENWTLPDGADFDLWFEIKGEGLCATLNDGVVSSTDCDNLRCWICHKILRAV